MRKTVTKMAAVIMALSMIGGVFSASGLSIEAMAAGDEKIMQVRAAGIMAGDIVNYSEDYICQNSWETGTPLSLPAVGTFKVKSPGRYDKTAKARILDLEGSATVKTQDIAFISSAVGGKDSDFKSGGDLHPVAKTENVTEWKLTIKNPYHEKKNPTGVREPEIKNIMTMGHCVVFDYSDIYSTGNSYLSAVILDRTEREVIAYDRIVDATERGNGTIAINWPREYDKNNYILKVFEEKYNGDRHTDYVGKFVTVYRGVDGKWGKED